MKKIELVKNFSEMIIDISLGFETENVLLGELNATITLRSGLIIVFDSSDKKTVKIKYQRMSNTPMSDTMQNELKAFQIMLHTCYGNVSTQNANN